MYTASNGRERVYRLIKGSNDPPNSLKLETLNRRIIQKKNLIFKNKYEKDTPVNSFVP